MEESNGYTVQNLEKTGSHRGTLENGTDSNKGARGHSPPHPHPLVVLKDPHLLLLLKHKSKAAKVIAHFQGGFAD